MFGKFFLCIFNLTLIGACAKPNYQDLPLLTGSENQTAGSCQLFFSNSHTCIELTWEKAPNDSDPGSFFLKFYLKEKPQESMDPNLSVAVVLFMPSMGHGSSPVKIEKISPGVFKASEIYFIMTGDWDIQIQLKSGANVVDQAIQKVSI